LLDTVLYADSTRGLRVSMQVRDAAGNVQTSSTTVFAVVGGAGGKQGSCMPDANTGICIAVISGISYNSITTLSISCGFSASSTDSIYFRVSGTDLGNVVTYNPLPSQSFTSNVQAVFPSRNFYAGESFTVPVYGRYDSTIGAAIINVTVYGAGLKLTALAPADTYTGTVDIISGLSALSAKATAAVPFDPNTNQLLLTATFLVSTPVTATTFVQLQVKKIYDAWFSADLDQWCYSLGDESDCSDCHWPCCLVCARFG